MKKARASLSIGADMYGDAYVYVQLLNEEGDHIRYATEEELSRWAATMDCGDGFEFEVDDDEEDEGDDTDDEPVECSACGDVRGTCIHSC